MHKSVNNEFSLDDRVQESCIKSDERSRRDEMIQTCWLCWELRKWGGFNLSGCETRETKPCGCSACEGAKTMQRRLTMMGEIGSAVFEKILEVLDEFVCEDRCCG